MLDVGWTELVVIAIVLIIVVGPKDLPPMLRTFGRMMTKMRGMAADFRHQFDEALREADLDDVRKTINDARSLNPANTLREAMNPLRQMGNEIKADLQRSTRPDTPVMTPQPGETAPVAAPAPIAPAEPSPPLSAVPPAAPLATPAAPLAAGEAAPASAASAAPPLPASPVSPVTSAALPSVEPAPVVTVEDIAKPKRKPRAKAAAGTTVPEAETPAPRKRTAKAVAALEGEKPVRTRKPKTAAPGGEPTATPKTGDEA